MNTSRLAESIRVHEGYRRYPYVDSEGYWTVGWGHKIHDDFVDTALPIGAIAVSRSWASQNW